MGTGTSRNYGARSEERQSFFKKKQIKEVIVNSIRGKIKVLEQTYYDRAKNRTYRPFEEETGLYSRSRTLSLERAITDLCSDVSFDESVKKVKEHYGIDISESTARKVTLKHSESILKFDQLKDQDDHANMRSRGGSRPCVIMADGLHIPIRMKKDENMEGDQRKNKKCEWRELRLGLAYISGSADKQYRFAFSSSSDTAKGCLYAAISVGYERGKKVHAVGDGAPWIAAELSLVFPKNSSYLLDYYHMSQYLYEASSKFANDSANQKKWAQQHQELMKKGKINEVFAELKTKLSSQEIQNIEKEQKTIENQDVKNLLQKQKNLKENPLETLLIDILDPLEKDPKLSPVYVCYRYLYKRKEQLCYKEALEQGLPIGSGEIESANKSIIQKRLKLDGTWWDIDNVPKMAALRVNRANNNWDRYWDSQKQRRIA